MSRTYYKHGQWNAICDMCGRKFKSGMLQLRWDGLRVCKRDYEERHPQDFQKAVPDNQGVPWTRSEPADAVTFSGVYIAADYFENDDYFGDV